MPTFAPNGYQQLGSPNNTASDFSTSVTEIADSLTWLKGRHTMKMGLDWRWERLNVIQPPWPTGSFAFSTVGSDLPGVANTGNAFASFLLGQVQTFAIDLQQTDIQERAHFQEYFIQDDWKVSNRLTLNPGLRYTLNFPSTEINGQTAIFNLQTRQLEYPGTDPVRPLKKNNFGPRFGAVYRVTDKTIVSSGYGLVWIEMAGITTPFTTPNFPFLQDVSQRTLDNIAPAFVLAKGPTVTPVSPTATAGLGQGVFTVDGTLGSGYAQQWNVSVQRELTSEHGHRSLVPRIEDYEHRNPGQQYQSVDGGPTEARADAPREGPQPVFRDRSAFVFNRRPDDHEGAADEAFSRLHRGQLLSEQCRHDELSGSGSQHSSAAVARPDLLGRVYALEADRHRLVGVRRVRSDGAADERRRGRQPQSRARPRLLDRRHSPLFRRLGGVGSSGGPGPRDPPRWRARRAGQRLEHRLRDDAAVRRACAP